MEQIINQLVANFDFALMLIINIITYGIIKIIDELNGNKVPTTWQKRIVFLVTAIVLGIIYKYCTDVHIHVIINSCVIAPVAWSWLAKPIAIRFGIDYKKNK
jgi:hypothetical protein